MWSGTKWSGGRDRMMIPYLPNLIKSASDTQRLFCPGRCRPRPGPSLGSDQFGAERVGGVTDREQ